MSRITLCIFNIFIIGLFSVRVFAQETPEPLPVKAPISPGFIAGITGGYTVPFGNFTKADFFNTASGFAGPGGNGGITATYFFNKHWGVAELFSYHQFSFLPGNLSNSMVAYPGGFGADTAICVVKGDNHTYNFLVGPAFTLTAGKKLNVDFRVLGGFINANLAGNNITLTDAGKSQTFTQAVSWANTLGGQCGAALRYSFSAHAGASVNVDFFYSKPDFDVNNVNRISGTGREIYTYNQPVEGINANLSLYYMMDHK